MHMGAHYQYCSAPHYLLAVLLVGGAALGGLVLVLATALEGGDRTELAVGFFVAVVEAGGFLGGISRRLS